MNEWHISTQEEKLLTHPDTLHFTYLQFLEIAAFARSIVIPSKVIKFATSYGPLSSVTEGAALVKIRFFPLVQSTSS